MNNFIKDELNSWLYISGELWEEDWNGEPVLANYPFTLNQICDFLNDKVDCLSESGDNIFFEIADGVFQADRLFKSTPPKKYMFNTSSLNEGELKGLYQTGIENLSDDILHNRTIQVSIAVPCSEDFVHYIQSYIPLSLFFKIVKDFSNPPELKIEDIPF